MKFTVEFTGGEALAKAFAQVGKAMERTIAVKALKLAAEPMRDRMASLAPWGMDYPHLADGMVVTVANRIGSTAGGKWSARAESEHAVAVGPSKEVFYGLMQEYGTTRHGAQPFARPAFDATKEQSLDILRDEAWKAIQKAIP